MGSLIAFSTSFAKKWRWILHLTLATSCMASQLTPMVANWDRFPPLDVYKFIPRAAQDVQLHMHNLQFPPDLVPDDQGHPGDIPDEDDANEVLNPYLQLQDLIRFPADRTFIFWRPDPFNVRRPIQSRFEASPTTTIANIGTHIIARWPDLLLHRWRAVVVHEDAQTMCLVGEDELHVIIEADVDLLSPNGASVVMIEIQTWNLKTARLETQMLPHSIWIRNTAEQLFFALNLQDACEFSPCIIWHNGNLPIWKNTMHFQTGAYIRIGRNTMVEHLRTVIGDPTGPAASHEPVTIPQDFSMQARITNGRYFPDRLIESVVANAQTHQFALTIMARQIYTFTSMNSILSDYIAICTIEEESVTFHRIHHSARYDPYALLIDLHQRDIAAKVGNWMFVAIDPSTAASQLPDDVHYLGVIHHFDRRTDA